MAAEKESKAAEEASVQSEAAETAEAAAQPVVEEGGQEEAPEETDETEKKEGSEEESADEPQAKEKKKRFGFKDKKEKKELEKANAERDEAIDRYKRSLAEFDNYRKRTEKEKSAMFDMGAKSIIEKILPVIDNFERGLAGLSEEQKKEPFADGVDKVYRQMLKSLTDAGLEQIEAVGKPFDPNFHNAVMHVENENLGENVVAQEFQKGYTYKGSVVRHSMVQVAN